MCSLVTTDPLAVLDLDHYRAAVALDAPFDPGPPATPHQLPALVASITAHLEADGTGERLHAVMDPGPTSPRARLRALLTVRPPAPLPQAVLRDLDALLQAERRPAVAPASLPALRSHGTRLALWQGDITTLAADAIVNAANSGLLGCFHPFHACIDNAIHAAAGPRLREDCGRIMHLQGAPEPTGTAKATRASHLPSRFVLHTVGPIVRGAPTPDDAAALERCYRACLDLAQRLPGVRSVALCAISTGVFGFPRGPAARIALSAVGSWLEANPGALELVIFDVFGDEDLAAARAAFAAEGLGA